MSDGGMTPSQFQILREDFKAMRIEFQSSIRELVTRESFRDEQKRTDERFEGQGRELGDLKRDLSAEAQARVTAEQNSLHKQLAETREREKLRRSTTWQWFALAATLIVGPIVGGLIGSALAGAGLTP